MDSPAFSKGNTKPENGSAFIVMATFNFKAKNDRGFLCRGKKR